MLSVLWNKTWRMKMMRDSRVLTFECIVKCWRLVLRRIGKQEKFMRIEREIIYRKKKFMAK